MNREGDPLARGLEAAYGQRSVLDVLAEKTGLPTRINVAPDTSGPMLKPLAAGAAAAAGKYQLQGEIARGAMGAVIKGYDTHLGRDVAIKLLHAEYLADPGLLERFVEEAQIGGQLQHPGIVPVYDLAMQGKRPFFSMKLVKGRTLSALLGERPHPAHQRRRFLAIFEQVCLTMAYAHARGVIHRDLKPANVMVGAYGEVQVVDWGMGKVLGRAESKPRPDLSVIATVRSDGRPGSQSVVGSVMGTPAYMPPEQAMGDIDRMDARSDVFSLGAMLCQILTGQPPYVGGDLMQRAARADLAECRERLDACDADEELKRLVRDCLTSAHLARPNDAGDVARRVGEHIAAVEDRTHRARVEAAAQRAKADAAHRKQKLTLGLAASVLGLLTLGGGGWWWIRADRAERGEQHRRAVKAALAEARIASGARDWDAAVGAARRAHALANDDETATYLAEVQARQAAARDLADRLAAEEETLRKLEAIPIPPAGNDFMPSLDEARRRDEAYRTLLRDPESLALDEVTQPERWATALQDWAFAGSMLDGGAREHLLELVKALDSDERRTQLRDLLLADATPTAELRQLADEWTDLDPMTANTLAALLASHGEHRRAVDVLRTAHEGHPDHYLVALRCADSAGRGRQFEEQLRFGAIAAALRPDSAAAWFLQGCGLYSLGRYPESLECFERGHALGSARSDWNHRWAERLEQARELAAAEPRLERLLEREAEPDNETEAARAALLGLQRGEHTKVVALAREYPAAHDSGSCSAALTGDGELAITWLREKLAGNPTKKDLEWMLEDEDLESLRTDEHKAFWDEVRKALEEAK